MSESLSQQKPESARLRECASMTVLMALSGLAIAGVMRAETALAERQLSAIEAERVAEDVTGEEGLQLEHTIRWFANLRGCDGGDTVGFVFRPTEDTSVGSSILVCNGVTSPPTAVHRVPSQ